MSSPILEPSATYSATLDQKARKRSSLLVNMTIALLVGVVWLTFGGWFAIHHLLVDWKFARLNSLVSEAIPERTAVTSFLCRTYKGVCGPNWIIVGEAASQSEPITGNGVTAALRHTAEASSLICKYRDQGRIPFPARAAYNMRVLQVGSFFNSLIEKFFYQPPLRARLGLFGTARTYTVPAWLTNLMYSRMRPRRLLGSVLFCSALVAMRLVAWAAFQLSRFFAPRAGKSQPSGDERKE